MYKSVNNRSNTHEGYFANMEVCVCVTNRCDCRAEVAIRSPLCSLHFWRQICTYEQWLCLWGSFHVLIICYYLNMKCPQVLTLKVWLPTCGTILWHCRNFRRQGLSWGIRLPGTGLWWYWMSGPFLEFPFLLTALCHEYCSTLPQLSAVTPALCHSPSLSQWNDNSETWKPWARTNNSSI